MNLPDYCFSVNLSDGKLIRLSRGERGFFPIPDSQLLDVKSTFGEKSYDAIADELNELIAVNKGQREAMYIGSLFGFHVPGANPDLYNTDGSKK